jgi:hypothetical protein
LVVGVSIAIVSGGVVAAMATTAAPLPAYAASSVGGTITRSEVLARAKTWADAKVPYSQEATYPDPQGKRYRTDCSGYVSMAWHLDTAGTYLDGGYNTGQFQSWSGKTVIGYDDLLPGDALLAENASHHHIVLFISWTSGAHTTANVYSEPTDNPTAPVRWAYQTTYSRSTLTNDGYQAIRYNKIVDDPVSVPPPPPRVGVLGRDGSVVVKEGGLDQTWSNEATGVKQVVVDGTRVGVLTTDGRVFVKDGSLDAVWSDEYTGVAQIALSGNRIGVLTNDGTVLVKEGGLDAVWNTLLGGAKQLALAGSRVAVVTGDGHGLVKDGPLNAAWSDESTNTVQIALSGNRIGVLTTDGSVVVKEGGLDAVWNTLLGGAKQLALAGSRVAVVTADGHGLVKDGQLSAVWSDESANTVQIAVTSSRVGVLTTDGSVVVKDGGLDAGWNTVYGNATQLSLS